MPVIVRPGSQLPNTLAQMANSIVGAFDAQHRYENDAATRAAQTALAESQRRKAEIEAQKMERELYQNRQREVIGTAMSHPMVMDNPEAFNQYAAFLNFGLGDAAPLNAWNSYKTGMVDRAGKEFQQQQAADLAGMVEGMTPRQQVAIRGATSSGTNVSPGVFNDPTVAAPSTSYKTPPGTLVSSIEAMIPSLVAGVPEFENESLSKKQAAALALDIAAELAAAQQQPTAENVAALIQKKVRFDPGFFNDTLELVPPGASAGAGLGTQAQAAAQQAAGLPQAPGAAPPGQRAEGTMVPTAKKGGGAAEPAPWFSSEAAARAAGMKNGDRVVIGNQVGVLG